MLEPRIYLPSSTNLGVVNSAGTGTIDPTVFGSTTGDWTVSDGSGGDGHSGVPGEVWAANTFAEDRLIIAVTYYCVITTADNIGRMFSLYTGPSGGPFVEILPKIGAPGKYGARRKLPIPIRVPKGQRLSCLGGWDNGASQQDFVYVTSIPMSSAAAFGYPPSFSNYPTRYQTVYASTTQPGRSYDPVGTNGIGWSNTKFSTPKALIGCNMAQAGGGSLHQFRIGEIGSEVNLAHECWTDASDFAPGWMPVPEIIPANTRVSTASAYNGILTTYVVDPHEVPSYSMILGW